VEALNFCRTCLGSGSRISMYYDILLQESEDKTGSRSPGVLNMVDNGPLACDDVDAKIRNLEAELMRLQKSRKVNITCMQMDVCLRQMKNGRVCCKNFGLSFVLCHGKFHILVNHVLVWNGIPTQSCFLLVREFQLM